MLKIINKIIIGIKSIGLSLKNARRKANLRGLFKNPFFYFGLVCFILFGMILSSDSLANFNGLNNSHLVFFNSFFNSASADSVNKDSLFFSQNDSTSLETPDLKIMQDNTLGGISTPRVLSPKVLGDVLGGTNQNRKDIVEYSVQPGDTTQSIADSYGISVNTLLWANDLTNSSAIKVGQDLVILPVDGVLHIVKSGDTLSAIAQKYKSSSDEIVAFNDLANQDDVYIGDILIVPGGVMPKKAAPIINNDQIPLADNFFIFPTQGRITQGLHYYNAIDVANSCGTSIYAAASGIVQRAIYNNAWNLGMGNYVTILHASGIVTYYGHLQNVFVKPGDKVNVGDRIGLMGRTGNATGCHVHFEVVGAKNPLARYALGATISLK